MQVLGALRGKILAKSGVEPWTPYNANLSMQGIKVCALTLKIAFVLHFSCTTKMCHRQIEVPLNTDTDANLGQSHIFNVTEDD